MLHKQKILKRPEERKKDKLKPHFRTCHFQSMLLKDWLNKITKYRANEQEDILNT